MTGILLDQLAAAVGAAAVDDDPLEVAEGLGNDAFDGPIEAVAVVIVDGDDGKLHNSIIIIQTEDFKPSLFHIAFILS